MTSDRGLYHTRQLLAAIVASSDDAIISKTVDGVITGWNAGATRIFGYGPEEVIGRPIAILAVPGAEDEMSGILARLRQGERIDHFETCRRHKNGAIVTILLTISPIVDDAGVIIAAAKVARDLTASRMAATALKLAEDRLRDQHRELLHAARLSELGQMAAMLAHEINQPLGAVITYLQAGQLLLADHNPASRIRLETALRQATGLAVRTGEIVSRLRLFAKPNDGHLRPEPLHRIIEEATALATVDAAPRGVRVVVSSPAVTAMVLADRVEIQQVVVNLIRNALEAMDGQDRRELQISTAALPDAIEVAVADTGPGLAPTIRESLFQPFVTTKAGGMGLGLSICRRIISGHGGTVWAEDRRDGGTIFRFTLRAA
jgi:two-component system sensor kinase FixL